MLSRGHFPWFGERLLIAEPLRGGSEIKGQRLDGFRLEVPGDAQWPGRRALHATKQPL